MKAKIIFILALICLLSCNKKIEKESKNFYPYSLKFSNNSYLFYDLNKNVLFERKENRDSLSNTYFLEFKTDSINISIKKVKLPTFYKSFLKLKNEFIILNTTPRTLGKNTKSTDFVTKYNKDLQITLKKDMDISKYPNGNSFLVGDDNKLFYITDGFKFNENRKLIISQLDDSLNIINQKVFERQKKDFVYNPIKCILVENKGIVIVSNISDISNINNKKFRLEMFDLSLNKKWSEDLEVNSIISLDYSKSKSKIVLVTKKEGSKINFWDFNGNKQVTLISLNTKLISVTSNDENIFFIDKNQEKKSVTKIDFSGKVIDKINLSEKDKTKGVITSELIYRQNQLFLVNIDNFRNIFTINKIE